MHFADVFQAVFALSLAPVASLLAGVDSLSSASSDSGFQYRVASGCCSWSSGVTVLPGLGCRVASAAAALDQLNGRLDAVLLGQYHGFPYQLEMSCSLFKN